MSDVTTEQLVRLAELMGWRRTDSFYPQKDEYVVHGTRVHCWSPIHDSRELFDPTADNPSGLDQSLKLLAAVRDKFPSCELIWRVDGDWEINLYNPAETLWQWKYYGRAPTLPLAIVRAVLAALGDTDG